MARDYAELNTNLDSNQATVVPSLNGRQGDANREVYFWLKDGKTGVNLQGKTITLFAKDASGVVKTASTMNDTTGLSAGRFSLIIPAEFYQAEGTVQDSYLQVKNGDAVITTIPVSFQVLENTMLVTQTQSQLFLDTVQSTIDDFNSRIATTTTNLTTVENAQKALQVSIDNINTQFNSDLFAQKAKDNEFKGNNTFDNKIIAPAGLQGKADSAAQADNATNATNATTATNANHATTADTLTTTNSQTIQDLTVNGQFLTTSAQKTVGTTVTLGNWQIFLTRIGNQVLMHFQGTVPGSNWTQFNNNQPFVPAGYRPITWFAITLSTDGHVGGTMILNGDGTGYRRGSDGSWDGGVMTSVWFTTNDAWPS